MSRKVVRALFTIVILLSLFYLQESPLTTPSDPIQLYSTVCQDDLRKIYLREISSATHSIYLAMYSLTDPQIIEALNKKAQEGIDIHVMHDTSTNQKGYKKLTNIKTTPLKISGLMHKKILIIDSEKVWIGSANFTPRSLKVHDNLISGFTSPHLSQAIENETPTHNFTIEEQRVEFWTLPRDKKEGLARLISLIDNAQSSVYVAMYTWTNPQLTDAIIRAHNRGINVELILDRGQARGVGKIASKRLISAGVPVWYSTGRKLLHHKCMWVDEEVLVNGSANWTRAAFSKNRDCFFILHDLTEKQQKKLRTMWKRTRTLSNKQHLSVLGQRPEIVWDESFEFVGVAA